MLTIGSLFSGIGGLELGLEWAGLGPVLWQVEKDPYCLKVLAKHWPGIERYEDVKNVGPWNLEKAELICGGFPCQDISTCNPKGAGLRGSKSGLWYEFERIIDECQPAWIIIENTAGNSSRWVPAVGQRLDEFGYSTFPVELEARYVGASHRRARVFIIANTYGFEIRHIKQRLPVRQQERIPPEGQAEYVDLSKWPSRSDLRRADDGLPNIVDRNRALGNAVVPQVAQVIGEIVKELMHA